MFVGGAKVADYVYDGRGGRAKKIVCRRDLALYNDNPSTGSPSSMLFGNLNGSPMPATSGNPVVDTTSYISDLYEIETPSSVNPQQIRKTKFIYLGNIKVASVGSDGGSTGSPSIMYYHTDHLGGTNVLTDNTGAVRELTENDPFGQVIIHEKYGNDFATAWYYFTGKPLDDETGLIFLGARYYNPVLRRFIEPDSEVPSPENPQALNRDTYCNNNPVNLIDPTGHTWDIPEIGLGAIQGFGVGFISGVQRGGILEGLAGGLGGTISGAASSVFSFYNPLMVNAASGFMGNLLGNYAHNYLTKTPNPLANILEGSLYATGSGAIIGTASLIFKVALRYQGMKLAGAKVGEIFYNTTATLVSDMIHNSLFPAKLSTAGINAPVPVTTNTSSSSSTAGLPSNFVSSGSHGGAAGSYSSGSSGGSGGYNGAWSSGSSYGFVSTSSISSDDTSNNGGSGYGGYGAGVYSSGGGNGGTNSGGGNGDTASGGGPGFTAVNMNTPVNFPPGSYGCLSSEGCGASSSGGDNSSVNVTLYDPNSGDCVAGC